MPAQPDLRPWPLPEEVASYSERYLDKLDADPRHRALMAEQSEPCRCVYPDKCFCSPEQKSHRRQTEGR